jgi:hypothetical protein
LCFVALLTAAIAVGKTAAQSERDALMAGRGTVSFPVSCNANLQPRFDAALAALHSFWYGQALKESLQALRRHAVRLFVDLSPSGVLIGSGDGTIEGIFQHRPVCDPEEAPPDGLRESRTRMRWYSSPSKSCRTTSARLS